MRQSRVRDIKHAQKESNLYHKISQFFIQIQQDEPNLAGVSISRVTLSPDKGSCVVHFYCPGGMKEFEAKRPILVLYKSSLRKALATAIPGRYTPTLTFTYDQSREKQRRVEELLDTLKEEGTE